jgi:hypothetical protein
MCDTRRPERKVWVEDGKMMGEKGKRDEWHGRGRPFRISNTEKEGSTLMLLPGYVEWPFP